MQYAHFNANENKKVTMEEQMFKLPKKKKWTLSKNQANIKGT